MSESLPQPFSMFFLLDSQCSKSFAEAECFWGSLLLSGVVEMDEEVSGRETRHQHHLNSLIAGVSMLVN